MALNPASLFVANAVILFVMALAFLAAWHGQRHERYWISWTLANVVLGVSLVAFIVAPDMPAPLAAVLPNGLLILGLGLRWRAARQFGRRAASATATFGPAALFAALCILPWYRDQPGLLYSS